MTSEKGKEVIVPGSKHTHSAVCHSNGKINQHLVTEPSRSASDLEVHGCHVIDFGVVMEMGLDLD